MSFINKYKRYATFTVTGAVDRQIDKFTRIVDYLVRYRFTKKDCIVIFYHTEGGCVSSGNCIRDILKEIQKITNVAIVNTGYVASMGMVIYLAVKNRFAFPNAKFMAHQAFLADVNLDTMTTEDALKDYKSLKKTNRQMYRDVISKLKFTKKQVEWYNSGKDLKITAKESYSIGLSQPFEVFKKG